MLLFIFHKKEFLVMINATPEYIFKGVKTARLEAGRYTAVIAYTMGSSVLRFRDEQNKVEVFRYKDDVTADQINEAREIWGLPSLYLPNRFDRGVIKTSDATYTMPINETLLDNFIHGFVHKREHKLELCEVQGDKAVCRTSFEFDEQDELFEHFPLKFKWTLTFTLSEAEGLVQEITLENKSDKALPVSVCTHTCINAPITDGGDLAKLTFEVPIGKRCVLDDRCLPTEELRELDDYDKKYKSGDMQAVLHDISNDMYTAEETTLDGKPFYGVIITDRQSGRRVINEVSKEFKFWNMWNDKGVNGYFCPEPMTAMINSPNLSLPREITGYRELDKGERFTCWQRFAVL